MITLEELLQKGEVWVLVENRKEFLNSAKENGFVWADGSEINADEDCFFHMAISGDKKIANVPMTAWFSAQFKDKPKYVFEDFLKKKSRI